MAAVTAIGHRYLPRGWRDFGLQLAIWLGFGLAYQVARGMADRSPAEAFENGIRVVDLERHLSGLWELSLQSWAHSSELLTVMTSWTYWLSQFPVLGVTLLWVYLRRNGAFTRLRNALIFANLLGLVGYVLLPTAPPRMFPELGFVDTLAVFGGIDHDSGAVQFASNPYAAMPSLHSADALILGVVLGVLVCRRWWTRALWLTWPAWVWFSVIATGNHFWLDVVAGFAVALVALAVVYRAATRRLIAKLL